MQSLFDETRFLMRKYNISAAKSLGQNFLINEEVIENIVKTADIEKEDLVIEIGPGLGSLTKELIKKSKKVICIELDERMIKILKERFAIYDNIEIINQDVLKVDLNNLIKEEKEKNKIKNVKVVANLPYYITTPIIMKLLEEKLDIESITVMIQKEVAKRLCEVPGGKNTGAITYAVYYYAQAHEIIEVPNSSFIPEPEVTSEVIKLAIRKIQIVEVENEELMFKVIKAAFMQRRKTLANALVNSKILSSKEEVDKMFTKLGIDKNVRGEKLKIEQYVEITNYLEKLYK